MEVERLLSDGVPIGTHTLKMIAQSEDGPDRRTWLQRILPNAREDVDFPSIIEGAVFGNAWDEVVEPVVAAMEARGIDPAESRKYTGLPFGHVLASLDPNMLGRALGEFGLDLSDRSPGSNLNPVEYALIMAANSASPDKFQAALRLAREYGVDLEAPTGEEGGETLEELLRKEIEGSMRPWLVFQGEESKMDELHAWMDAYIAGELFPGEEAQEKEPQSPLVERANNALGMAWQEGLACDDDGKPGGELRSLWMSHKGESQEDVVDAAKRLGTTLWVGCRGVDGKYLVAIKKGDLEAMLQTPAGRDILLEIKLDLGPQGDVPTLQAQMAPAAPATGAAQPM